MLAARVLFLVLASASVAGCASTSTERCSLAGVPTSGTGHAVGDATWRAHASLRSVMTTQRANVTLDCAEARAILRSVDGPSAPPASLALSRGGQTWFVEFFVAAGAA